MMTVPGYLRHAIATVLCACLIVLALAICVHTMRLPPRYTVTDLGTLGGNRSWASDIDDRGQVVGRSSPEGRDPTHGFIWDSTAGMRDIGTLGGGYSGAACFNDVGQVGGYAEDELGVSRPVIWDPVNGVVNVSDRVSEATSPMAIFYLNKQGSFLSSVHDDDGKWRHFFWSETSGMVRFTTPSAPAFPLIQARDLNDLGEVAGVRIEGGTIEHYHAILWSATEGTIDLGSPSGDFSFAWANNQKGEVLCSWKDPRGDIRLAVWTRQGGMADLGPLGSEYHAEPHFHPQSFNNHRQAVGRVTVPAAKRWVGFIVVDKLFSTNLYRIPRLKSAFLVEDGVYHDLNSLIDVDSGWVLQDANAINDHGQIVGRGRIDGETHAYLLTPIDRLSESSEH